MQEGAVLSFIAVNGDNRYKWTDTTDTPLPTYREGLAQTIPILCPGIKKKRGGSETLREEWLAVAHCRSYT